MREEFCHQADRLEEEPIIEVRGLVSAFGNHRVHAGLDLSVRRGEILAIVGGSGSGKSVLLKTIIGLIKPQAGQIVINGQDQAILSEKESMEARRDWGVLFQDGALFSSLTVGQNIQVPLREHFSLSQKLMDALACSKLALAGLPFEVAAKYPSDLSGGMRKRSALARALALDPQILFLDEPTAGLDPIGAAGFDDLIKELSRALGLTVVLITHDLDSLAQICDRVAVVGEKRILTCGTLADVRRFEHPWVQEYFNGARGRASARP